MPPFSILLWLKDNWKGVVAGLLILGLCIYIGSLKERLGSALGDAALQKGLVSQRDGVIKQWMASYDALNTKLGQSNESILKAKTLADKNKNEALEAIKKNASMVAQRAEIENAAKKREIGNSGDKTCDDAVADAKADLKALSK